MKSSVAWVMAGLVWCGAARSARGQSMVVAQENLGVPITLESVDDAPPFTGTAADGPSVTASSVNFGIGFNYLRPFWATRSLALTVPVGSSPTAGVIGATGDLSGSFAFVPKLDASYHLPDTGVAAGASAQFLGLNGTLQRTITTTAGSADLNANSNLTIISANLAEVRLAIDMGPFADNHPCFQCLEDDVLTISLGTRLELIQQHYNATLRSGLNTSSADGNQDFTGIGLTSEVADVHPLGERWSLYSNTRGSALLGTNNRKSVVSVVSAGSTAGSNNNLVENKTILLPVLELEMGVQYHLPLKTQSGDGRPPVLFVRAGAVGQFWWNIGFLSAADGSVSFGNRTLYLVGATLVAGFQY